MVYALKLNSLHISEQKKKKAVWWFRCKINNSLVGLVQLGLYNMTSNFQILIHLLCTSQRIRLRLFHCENKCWFHWWNRQVSITLIIFTLRKKSVKPAKWGYGTHNWFSIGHVFNHTPRRQLPRPSRCSIWELFDEIIWYIYHHPSAWIKLSAIPNEEEFTRSNKRW